MHGDNGQGSFEIAVNSEIRAKEAYEKLASLTKSDIIRDELLFLAKEEDKHREIIEKMAEKFKGERTEPKKIDIDVMAEFKVIAEKMAETIKKPDVNTDEVYEIAMQAELVSERLIKSSPATPPQRRQSSSLRCSPT